MWLDLALTTASKDALYVRYRKSSVLGWTIKHDDEHSPQEISAAASCYAPHADSFPIRGEPPPGPGAPNCGGARLRRRTSRERRH